MKLFALLLLSSAALLSTGCSYRIPPQNDLGGSAMMTSHERDQEIDRTFTNEGRQAADDFDHILLLEPAGTLSLSNVR